MSLYEIFLWYVIFALVVLLIGGKMVQSDQSPPRPWCRVTDKDYGTTEWWIRCRGATALPGQNQKSD